MNLTALKKEVERLKEAIRNKPVLCSCQYVEIQASQPLTTEQERILENNLACVARQPNRWSHVGFSSITVPAQPQFISAR